jgi:predicted TIM-barrel fold metal-dependent hydrolase
MTVDAHHHVWRQADLPWLMGPMQPRIFGPYEPIRRDYPMAEYLDDIAGAGVSKSIYVQANWPADRFEDETAWVQSVADETGWPHAIVGYADFLADDVCPQLDRLAGYPLVRGIRQQLHWHEKQMYRFAARPDLCADATLRRNVARLADYGWVFDLQVFAPQMAGAADLADACPEATFVLQHAGMLEDLSDAGRAEWRAGMARLADCPNVVTKLSAFGTLPKSFGRRLICSVPTAVYSAPTFRSKSSGQAMTPLSKRTGKPSRPWGRTRNARSSTITLCGSTGSEPGERHDGA